MFSLLTNFGRYGDVLKIHDSLILKALAMSSATFSVAVAVKQMMRSALIS